MCTLIQCFWGLEEGIRSPGAQVRSGYEPLDVGVGTRLKSFDRTASTLNNESISPALIQEMYFLNEI